MLAKKMNKQFKEFLKREGAWGLFQKCIPTFLNTPYGLMILLQTIYQKTLLSPPSSGQKMWRISNIGQTHDKWTKELKCLN